jgi:N,N'-diacetyllegionaminate synthase
MTNSTTVIAEIGENHTGDWDLARDMIEAAAEAGADIVKFQSYFGEMVSEDDPEREWFSSVELPDDVHFELMEYASKHGVEFLSSPFNLERTRFLVEDLGLQKIKIASPVLLNFGMLDYLNGRVDTIYLSTGLATLKEVKQAVDALSDVEEVCVMQCTSEYPCPEGHSNLAVLETYKDTFPERQVGYSDHTLGTIAPAMAVALGATVIEKHFTLDKSLEGTDHVLSVTPGELRELIGRIEQVENLIGSKIKSPTEAETQHIQFVRNRFSEIR